MSEPVDLEPEPSVSSNSTLETVKDITAGAAGGIAQVLIGEFTLCHFRGRINRSHKFGLQEAGREEDYSFVSDGCGKWFVQMS